MHHILWVEPFFEKNKTALMRWITDLFLDDIPHILEILQHLSAAQAGEPEIGSLWRDGSLQPEDISHLNFALRLFNWLIEEGVTTEQHRVLVDLICRDLELEPPEVYTRSDTSFLLELAKHLEPCLRFLGEHVGGGSPDPLGSPFKESMHLHPESWARIAEYVMTSYGSTETPHSLRLQASLWPSIPESTLHKYLYERVYKDSNALVSAYIPCTPLLIGKRPVYSEFSNTQYRAHSTTMNNITSSSTFSLQRIGA